MAMPSFAFSVHNFISSTGADAGFAAIIGLAILVLLYFAHARETATLRDEAALLTQRLQHAEARVAALTRTQAVAASQVRPAVVAMAPFAPAGTGAPALASATRMIPAELQIPEPEEPIVVQRPAAAPVPAMAMAGVGAGAAAVASPPLQAPAPSPRSAPVPAPATRAGGNGAGRAPVAPRPAARRRPLPALEPPSRKRRRSRLGRGIAVALVALVAVGIAVVLFALTSVGGSTKSTSGTTPGSSTPSTPHAGGASAFKPSTITVSVLNGTSVNQLAHRIGTRLVAVGYKEGTLATAAVQTVTRTKVAYLTGRKNRIGALHVAAALGLSRSAVAPIDASTLQVACPGPSACAANVVVTVGTDLASQ